MPDLNEPRIVGMAFVKTGEERVGYFSRPYPNLAAHTPHYKKVGHQVLRAPILISQLPLHTKVFFKHEFDILRISTYFKLMQISNVFGYWDKAVT